MSTVQPRSWNMAWHQIRYERGSISAAASSLMPTLILTLANQPPATTPLRQPTLLTPRSYISGTKCPLSARKKCKLISYRISPSWSRSEHPSMHTMLEHFHDRTRTNRLLAVVTRRAAATSSPSAAPTARDAPPRIRQSRDLPSGTWSSPPPSVRRATTSHSYSGCNFRTDLAVQVISPMRPSSPSTLSPRCT